MVPDPIAALPGGVPVAMVRIPAGTFQMGSPEGERGRGSTETLHPVTLTRDYHLGKYAVTQAQCQAAMGANPSSGCGDFGTGPDNPVYCVSWNDIAAGGGFLERMNQHLASTGQQAAVRVRLPTEAAWERPSTVGSGTDFLF